MNKCEAPQLSIILPCLNEAETLEKCIRDAQRAIAEVGLSGEVIVADNGSMDGSQAIAARLGAKVVEVHTRGYGSALRGGIDASQGGYVLFADADSSYDFSDAKRFVNELQDGYDLVVGNRFRGGIERNAMPWKHRYIGNPALSGIGRFLFGTPVRDFHCGLRAFTRAAYDRMELCTSGMEFASEMIVKASLIRLHITEVPTTLRPDGRSRPPHLRSWRDGWRHLRFLLLLSPQWLFLFPGILLFGLGFIVSLWLVISPIDVWGAQFDIHTLLVSGMSILLGIQLLISAMHVTRLSTLLGIRPRNRSQGTLRATFAIDRGILFGSLAFVIGVSLLLSVSISWALSGFSGLDPRTTMRQVIPSIVLATGGAQIVFGSFMIGFLNFVEEFLAHSGKAGK